MRKNKVLLSFDIEEFDFPRERGAEISLTEGVKVSSEGAEKILRVLEKHGVRATMFVTGNFARENPKLVQRMAKAGHEVACHGVDHFCPKPTDVAESKKIIKSVTGVTPKGWRQPRMFKIDYGELARQGFSYDSSVNPALIPGRYNNLRTPRRPFVKGAVTEVPTSAATALRVPLFWLSLHLFPRRVYLALAKSCLKRQGYFTTYFHPWEFTDLSLVPVVPWYILKNSGDKLVRRLDWLIKSLKEAGGEFLTYQEFLKDATINAKEGKTHES